MADPMEILPVEVQEELVRARGNVEGWAEYSRATPEQWMAYYDQLGPAARAFVVEHLLDLADQGSLCTQAQHEDMYHSFWQQLRGVTELHNARVDEVAALEAQLATVLGWRPPPDPAEPTPIHDRVREQFAAVERELYPLRTVEVFEVSLMPCPDPAHGVHPIEVLDGEDLVSEPPC